MSVEEIVKAKHEYEQKVKTLGRGTIKNTLDEFFNNHPEIEALRWRQYTPHFNDGEACMFSVGLIYVRPVGTDEDDNSGDYGDGFKEQYDFDEKKHKSLIEDMKKVDNIFTALEEALLVCFEDHVIVTAYRNKIETEEYEHD